MVILLSIYFIFVFIFFSNLTISLIFIFYTYFFKFFISNFFFNFSQKNEGEKPRNEVEVTMVEEVEIVGKVVEEEKEVETGESGRNDEKHIIEQEYTDDHIYGKSDNRNNKIDKNDNNDTNINGNSKISYEKTYEKENENIIKEKSHTPGRLNTA